MNDVEKAIEDLKIENELMQFDPNTGEDYPIELQNQDNQDLYNANLVAIEALEKQIPKKPREKHYEEEGERPYIKYKCPSCESKYQIHNFIDSYCNNCGQKLDWSEVE